MEPLRDPEVIENLADYFLQSSSRTEWIRERNHAFFMTGIFTGLRITRLIEIRVRDVRDSKGNIRAHIHLIEYKRNKERKLVINDELREILEEYVQGMKDYEYLFKSQKGNNQPLSRFGAYDVLKKGAEEFDLQSIACHTLRKTYGYMIYQASDKDPVTVKDALNLSDVHTALRYIGVIQDRVDTLSKNMRIRRKFRK
jgi:integrase